MAVAMSCGVSLPRESSNSVNWNYIARAPSYDKLITAQGLQSTMGVASGPSPLSLGTSQVAFNVTSTGALDVFTPINIGGRALAKMSDATVVPTDEDEPAEWLLTELGGNTYA